MMWRRRPRALVGASFFSVFTMALFVACGDDGAAPSGGPDGAPPPAPDGGAPDGAADGGRDARPDAADAADPKLGVVYANQTSDVRFDEGPVRSSATGVGASFSEIGELQGDGLSISSRRDCKRTALDAHCASFECPERDKPDSLVAGTITLRGGPGAATLAPQSAPPGYGQFDLVPLGEPLFRGGEQIVFHAAGSADIPAFDIELVAPKPLVVTRPAATPTDGGIRQLDLAKGAPVEFAWNALAAGTVRFEISQEYSSSQGGPRRGVVCEYAASEGNGTMAVSALSALPERSTMLSVNAFVETTVRAGDFDVRGVLAVSAKDPGDYLYPFSIRWR